MTKFWGKKGKRRIALGTMLCLLERGNRLPSEKDTPLLLGELYLLSIGRREFYFHSPPPRGKKEKSVARKKEVSPGGKGRRNSAGLPIRAPLSKKRKKLPGGRTPDKETCAVSGEKKNTH